MIPSILTTLALVASSLSFAGQILYSTITSSSLFVNGSYLTTGHHFVLTDSSTTTAPATYLRDETTPIAQWPTDLGTEYCTGNTGALLCTNVIKLTGSGGYNTANAGSFVCTSSTCSIVSARVFAESGSDALWGGWTTSPGTSSGGQLFNRLAPAIPRGGTIIGSGAYFYSGGTKFQTKDVPPGATVKFTWAVGNGTEDYSRTKAAAVLQYWKYYNP
jgi:hypothetical protein